MWILWLMILTETLNEETHGVITCMILHVKYVINLQQFFHLTQIKAKGFSPLLNNQKVSVHFFKCKRKPPLSNSLKEFMWILWCIILTETLNEKTCGVIIYMILHVKYVISLHQFFHLTQIKAKGFSPLLNNQKVSVHFFKCKKTLFKHFIETVHVNLVLHHFNRKTKWRDMWSAYMYEFACKVCD